MGRHQASSSGVQREEEPQDEVMRDIAYVEVEDLIGEWVDEIQELQVEDW